MTLAWSLQCVSLIIFVLVDWPSWVLGLLGLLGLLASGPQPPWPSVNGTRESRLLEPQYSSLSISFLAAPCCATFLAYFAALTPLTCGGAQVYLEVNYLSRGNGNGQGNPSLANARAYAMLSSGRLPTHLPLMMSNLG